MVQIIGELNSKGGRLGDLLGTALGKGLSNFSNTYYANKDLDKVINDKSLQNASPEKKLSALERALAPHGEVGQNLLKNRFAIEEQVFKEKKYNAEQKEDQRKAFLDKEKLALDKRKTAAAEVTAQARKYSAEHKEPAGGLSGQATPPAVSSAISNVLENSKNLKADELGLEFDKAGVPRAYANSYIENRRREDEADLQSFTTNKDFREKILSGKESYERDKNVLDQMHQLATNGKLPTPLLVSAFDSLGIPLGTLNNPDAEQFEKLSQELVKNITGTYGSRILKTEVDSFLKSIPTLLNSPQGKEKLTRQWQILNEGKKAYYDAYTQILKENPKRLPPDLHEKVLERASSRLNELSNEFRNMNKTRVVIDPNGIPRNIPADLVDQALQAGGRLQ